MFLIQSEACTDGFLMDAPSKTLTCPAGLRIQGQGVKHHRSGSRWGRGHAAQEEEEETSTVGHPLQEDPAEERSEVTEGTDVYECLTNPEKNPTC